MTIKFGEDLLLESIINKNKIIVRTEQGVYEGIPIAKNDCEILLESNGNDSTRKISVNRKYIEAIVFKTKN